ncbi:MAG: hypothetical protein II690_00070 [Ruminococcus sp.]|nr:hypothetical protein [Ruminococcus sp.]
MSVYSRAPMDLPPENVPENIGEKSADNLISRLFSGKPDSEKLLILALLFLIMREGGDKRLLLALAYIML